MAGPGRLVEASPAASQEREVDRGRGQVAQNINQARARTAWLSLLPGVHRAPLCLLTKKTTRPSPLRATAMGLLYNAWAGLLERAAPASSLSTSLYPTASTFDPARDVPDQSGKVG